MGIPETELGPAIDGDPLDVAAKHVGQEAIVRVAAVDRRS